VIRLDERFWSKVDKNGSVPESRPDLGPCWLWLASTDGKGYGKFWTGLKLSPAHVVAWEAINGPVPSGLVLDHLCRIRLCVRMTHSEPVTQRVNILRGIGVAAQAAKREHCPQGHRLDANNVYIEQAHYGPKRHCVTCRHQRDRQRDPVARLEWQRADRDKQRVYRQRYLGRKAAGLV
jgi:hypothetical protein